MFLRVEDGYYKGEIREFSPEAARALLASGRAENPFAEGVAVARESDETAIPASRSVRRAKRAIGRKRRR